MPVESIFRISNYPLTATTESRNDDRNSEKNKKNKKKEEENTRNTQNPSEQNSTQPSTLSTSDLASQIIDSNKLIKLLAHRPISPLLHNKLVSSYTKHAVNNKQSRQNSAAKKPEKPESSL